MKALKVPLNKAQKVKTELMEKGIFDNEYSVESDGDFLFIPVRKKPSMKYEVVEAKLKRIERTQNLRKALDGKFTAEEFEKLKTSFDTVGNIAILEIDKALKKKEKVVAEAIMKINKNITTVLKKSDIHSGTFRTQKLKYVAGIKTKEAFYRENNISLKLDVEKVYFSVRLSTERRRICEQIHSGEEILVMFSGCAPYPIVFSKNSLAREIYGVEINPVAHKYAVENLKLNRIDNVKLFLGDVRKVVPNVDKKFDRILMPLPKTAEEFLDVAFSKIKPGGMIHLYDFLREDEMKSLPGKKILKECKRQKKRFKILRTVKCGQFSPNVYRVCTDFRVLN
ncbi:class I SAM-dependent methyltransferase family protein [Candidatus Woesearchaeota archaeon]|nr:class I SAM-dependent methyltransferase family protein [Candidatus Woesearchaeota archaeon]